MKVLSFPELKSEKGIRFSRPHLYRLMKAKKFPAAIKLGEATTGWIESEVDDWMTERAKERA